MNWNQSILKDVDSGDESDLQQIIEEMIMSIEEPLYFPRRRKNIDLTHLIQALNG